MRRDGGTISYVMHRRLTSHLSGDSGTKPDALRLAVALHRAAYMVDAATRLVRSCARLVGAVTALVVAVAVLCMIASTRW